MRKWKNGRSVVFSAISSFSLRKVSGLKLSGFISISRLSGVTIRGVGVEDPRFDTATFDNLLFSGNQIFGGDDQQDLDTSRLFIRGDFLKVEVDVLHIIGNHHAAFPPDCARQLLLSHFGLRQFSNGGGRAGNRAPGPLSSDFGHFHRLVDRRTDTIVIRRSFNIHFGGTDDKFTPRSFMHLNNLNSAGAPIKANKRP
jgi:hypothetical protein